jgi:hypothetical protein
MTTKIGYIYAIENNFDSSTYIGLTTKTIKERFAQHLQGRLEPPVSCISLWLNMVQKTLLLENFVGLNTIQS